MILQFCKQQMQLALEKYKSTNEIIPHAQYNEETLMPLYISCSKLCCTKTM